jgi:hypothetical protein
MPDEPTPPPLTVEIDRGSTSTRGRPAHRTWLVRLRRADRAVILAIGLDHATAQNLTDRIDRLLHPNPTTHRSTYTDNLTSSRLCRPS